MDQDPEPTEQERTRFRALAWDIAFLRRACRLVVVPLGDGFWIGNQVVTREELVARARLERVVRGSESGGILNKVADRPVVAPPPPPADDQRCQPPIAASPARPVVQLERARLADEAYRRAALSECAQACSVLIDSFPWRERSALVETICARLQEHEGE